MPHLCDATCSVLVKKKKQTQKPTAKTFPLHFSSFAVNVGTFFLFQTLFCKHINYQSSAFWGNVLICFFTFLSFPGLTWKDCHPFHGFVVETMLPATLELNISVTWRPGGLRTQRGLQKFICQILTSLPVKSRCSNVHECKHDNMRFLLYRRLCAVLFCGQKTRQLPPRRKAPGRRP